MKKYLLVPLILILTFLLSACSLSNEPVKKTIFAMDTVMELTAYGKNAQIAIEEAEAKIYEIDNQLSTGIESSDISILNAQGKNQMSDSSIEMINEGIEMWKETDGAFNIAIYPIMQLWGFDTEKYQVPNQDDIDNKLSLCDVSKISVNGNEVSFETDGMKIDLGGIAKGFTSDQIMDIFEKNNISSGIVSLGGNVQVYGKKTDGSLYKVAIQDPDDSSNYIGYVTVSDGSAVITSGGYQRYFEEDGEIYHHIIDASTGHPADSGIKSVTIVSKDGMLADALSTSLYVMGVDRAVDFWKNNAQVFDFIIVEKNGNIVVSQGLEKIFFTNSSISLISQ